MQWLLAFLAEPIKKGFGYVVKKFIQSSASFLGWVAAAVALFMAFLAFVKLSIQSIQVVAPPEISFALGFFPPVVFDLASLYLTILTAKRVHDWKQNFSKSYYETEGQKD